MNFSKIKEFGVLLLFLSLFQLQGVNWYSDVENATDYAKKYKKPLIVVFINENYSDWRQSRSKSFIDKVHEGLFNDIEKNFVFAKIDVRNNKKAAKSARFLGVSLSYAPNIYSVDYNPVRGLRSPRIYNKETIISRISSSYYSTGMNLLRNKQFKEGLDCLKIIKDIDDYYGKAARKFVYKLNSLKIDANSSKKIKPKKNRVKAKKYLKTAKYYLKNKKFNKAYAYLDKVIQLLPRTKMAKEAIKLQKNIEDKVDKSVLILKNKKKHK